MSERPEHPVETSGLEMAVVGMALRFPGASDAEAFWRLLEEGRESVRELGDEDLLAAGTDRRSLADPRYVRRVAALEDVELFDASFFGFSPREAEIMDPQHRFFLECAWEAVEDAGYDPLGGDAVIGVYGGAGVNSYAWSNLATNPELVALLGGQQARVGNRVDNLTTRVCYKLGLRGPGVTVQTTCSTSLVAVHLACQGVLAGDCDMALAGGVTITVPQARGYLYQEGGILSPDGRCRPFDARSAGFVPGNGAGVVLLKRLEDALADGDRVRAVILGTAINNDGNAKVGYTAPSVEGQADTILAAQRMAGVDPASISYVEAHGTATPIGDPIEVSALTQVFDGVPPGRCALGSVKGNIGHLDAAAGVAGLVKTVLSLEREAIPPTLHFERPNPHLDLEASPFHIVSELTPWKTTDTPRRAGVSSFGIGGTNAHAILEEAPERPPSSASREAQLLVLSARTSTALDAATTRLREHLQRHPELSPADVAWTLQVGRHPMSHRRAVVCRGVADAVAALGADAAGRRLDGTTLHDDRPVAFLFPGQGSQRPGMGADLYRSEPVFRSEVDRTLELLDAATARALRRLVFDPGTSGEVAAGELRETSLAQPALFIVEHALARLWLAWGIRPAALLGHSIGELVAASLAGVAPFETMLHLVAERGRRMGEMPGGAMLVVAMPEADLDAELAAFHAEGTGAQLEPVVINGPEMTVVGGSEDAVAALGRRLAGRGVETRRLHTSHAFHSAAMAPAARAFEERLSTVDLRPPEIPFLSNLTGSWITDEEATSPRYWSEQLRRTVRFGDGLAALAERFPEACLLEVGPGRSLAMLVRRHPTVDMPVTGSLEEPGGPEGDAAPLRALGRLWTAGVAVDWRGLTRGERRHRVGLPTYPFERRRYWVEPAGGVGAPGRKTATEAATEAPRSAPDVPAAASTPPVERPELSARHEAPRDALEAQLAGIWEEVLGVGGVGVHDDFFELGGDSLLASRVAARLRTVWGREVALGVLLEATTIAAQAERLRTPEPEAGVLPPLEPVDRGRPLPLSFAQEQLWFLDRLEPGSDAYNMATALDLEGDLHPVALSLTLDEVVRRHEAVRTALREVDGRPVQRIEPARPVPLPLVDLTALEREPRRTALRGLARREASRSFDLRSTPLLRARLVRLDSRRHVLLLTLHHICCDGWSWSILYRELSAIYRAFAAGSPSPLAELPVQYGDYSVWQRRWMAPEVLKPQIAYWRRHLAGLPVFRPRDERPRPAVPDRRAGRAMHRMPRELVDSLQALGQEMGATLFMLLTAAFAAVMHQRSGQRDLVLGSDVANRRVEAVERLIGFFVNQIVLRFEIPDGATLRDIVAVVQEVAEAAFAHQNVPFSRLVGELQPLGERFRSPLFQWKLVLQSEPLPGDGLIRGGARPEPLPVHGKTAKFDLLVNLRTDSDGLRAAVEYREELYSPAFVAALLEDYETVLGVLTTAAERPLSDLVAEFDTAAFHRDEARLEAVKRRSFAHLKRRALVPDPPGTESSS